MLKVGSVYRHEGRLWRCGLVNESRARLDPISSFVVAGVASGRAFQSYGTSINIGSTSDIEEVDVADLNEADLERYVRLGEREEQMTGGGGKGERLKQLNAERMQRLAANQAARELKEHGTADVATPPRDKSGRTVGPRSKGPVARDKTCKCGCGGMTGGWFIPGHDARFKGWLLKIERGTITKEATLTPEVIAAYTWIKKGEGEIPTTNYKGEPHGGYEE